MRELVIKEYKRFIDNRNAFNDWQESWTKIEYPNFAPMSDEEILAGFIRFICGSCAPSG